MTFAAALPILIVGAGPTGLNLALRLARDGIAFRIIDAHGGPAEESRALAVHARTLELYAQLGLADAMVEAGVKIAGIRMLEGGVERAHAPLGDIGAGLSPYPFILDFPQDEHERFLVDRLREAGVEVERSTSLIGFEQDADGVDVVMAGASGEERARFAYVCGCDGARSAVRKGLGVGFGGGAYEHLYYVADVRLAEPDGRRDFHLAMGADTFALRLPARRGEMERLIGFAPDGVEHPTFDDVRPSAEHLLQTRVAELNWFSTYRVQHRVADHFRRGRAFLLGDAGHLHSPAGGQGMNTGIGDAANLAWKLAAVVSGHAPAALLDSYEPERIAFARKLVATTDRMFRLVVSGGLAGRMVRTVAAPTALPIATRFAAARRALFRIASQIAVRYPQSPLSQGRAGGVAGGDRLPWVAEADNFAPLAARDWQLHVHGEPGAELAAAARALALPLHAFPWSQDARHARYARGAAYLVRPDGYVGLAASAQGAAEALKAYAEAHGLSFGPGAGPDLLAR